MRNAIQKHVRRAQEKHTLFNLKMHQDRTNGGKTLRNDGVFEGSARFYRTGEAHHRNASVGEVERLEDNGERSGEVEFTIRGTRLPSIRNDSKLRAG